MSAVANDRVCSDKALLIVDHRKRVEEQDLAVN
jgi:hypothetical protein